GPRSSASLTGCGVDQGHLHVVGLGDTFANYVLATTRFVWREAPTEDPWQQLNLRSDYLLLSNDVTTWTTKFSQPMSQFFRRKVASFLGRPAEWDYRTCPHHGNAAMTAALFNNRLAARELDAKPS